MPDAASDPARRAPRRAGADRRPQLLTRQRRLELARIALVGVVTLAYWRTSVPLPALLVAVAVGLYPLVRIGVTELRRERKVGTEIFVSVATLIALAGGE